MPAEISNSTMNQFSNNQTGQSTSDKPAINRRDVLKAAGTTGGAIVALSAATGTVAAGGTPDQLYFCGCSQVVVTGLADNSITVYLRKTEEGGCKTVTVNSPDCEVGGEREFAFGYEYRGGEAILAVKTPDGNIWCNPNNCAEKWQKSLECFDVGTLNNECAEDNELDEPGDIFTSKCGTCVVTTTRMTTREIMETTREKAIKNKKVIHRSHAESTYSVIGRGSTGR